MKYRHLPRTALTMSEVGFPLSAITSESGQRLDDAQRVQLLQTAFDMGVTFFDTADVDGEGYGEEVLAKAFPQTRHEMVIASKFGYDFYDRLKIMELGRPQHKFEASFARYACEQSLRRLKSDYIDLYQLHYPNIDVLEDDELFDTLDQLVKEGKIRYYGAALGPELEWREEGEASILERKVSALQAVFNILEQEPAFSCFPLANREKVGFIPCLPHAHGALRKIATSQTGPIQAKPPLGRDQSWMDKAVRKGEHLHFLAEETGRTLGQAAIKFCLAKPAIVSVLPTIKGPEDLNEWAAAPDTPDISEEELAIIQELWENGFDVDPPRYEEEEC